MVEYIAEYAKTGRSSCKGKCKQPIAKGELRIASTGGEHNTPYWRHWGCVTGKVITNIGSYKNLQGFSTLTKADQDMIIEAFKNPPAEPEKKTKKRKKAAKDEVNDDTQKKKKKSKAKFSQERYDDED